MKIWSKVILLVLSISIFSCDGKMEEIKEKKNMKEEVQNTKEIILGSGCFWCIEAIYQRIKGVVSIEVGFANGTKPSAPTYREVISQEYNFVEAAKIIFNPKVLSYAELFDYFLRSHDPTSLNKQGADTGVQYRSAVLYQSEEQKQIAIKFINKYQQYYDKSIVTEIVPLENFYPAENYHQNYYQHNPDAGYCRVVILPKLKKLNLLNIPINDKK